MPALEQTIKATADCRLVIIDPVSAYLGGTDSHKNAELRGLLAPLAELASRFGVAVVIVTHLSKGQNRKAMHAPTGSIAFVAAARAAWLVTADKADAARKLFLPIKLNLAKDPGGLAFRIVDCDVGGLSVGAVQWEAGRVDVSADIALSDEPDSRGQGQVQLAAAWLRIFLANGPVLQDEVRDAGENGEGFSWATIKRAKEDARIVSRKQRGNGKWEWLLPGSTLMQPTLAT